MITENIKKEEIRTRIISIWLDGYDDIFSDFDPRDFTERNISDDFLNEVKKVARENEFEVSELRLLLPEKNRNPEKETIIMKRLHLHFKKYLHYFQTHTKQEQNKGFLFLLIGMIMMVGAGFISSLKSESFSMHILLVVFEPAGWFLVWAGMDNLIYRSREQRPDLNFYSKLSKSKIAFFSM